ncbi:Alpha/beta hydrolase domain-containing protein 11 [Balamuthia mandrillaris]
MNLTTTTATAIRSNGAWRLLRYSKLRPTHQRYGSVAVTRIARPRFFTKEEHRSFSTAAMAEAVPSFHEPPLDATVDATLSSMLQPLPQTTATTATTMMPVVDLEYTIVSSRLKARDPSSALLILHGLFGSGMNWRNIGKRFSYSLKYDCHLVDLRNHGRSPHTETMYYSDMVEDVRALILRNKDLKKVSVMGHSMGGKVAMGLASRYPELVDKLVVVDVAPVAYAPARLFEDYVYMMKTIPLNPLYSRSQIEEVMKLHVPVCYLLNFRSFCLLLFSLFSFILTFMFYFVTIKQDATTRGFLMTNLVRDELSKVWSWRINVDTIEKFLVDVRDFYHLKYSPNNGLSNGGTTGNGLSHHHYHPNGASLNKLSPPHRWETEVLPPFHGETLFVGGSNSNYITPNVYRDIFQMFPNARILPIEGAGHWLHFTHPEEFLKVATPFLQS